jgi:hypothetical protein
MYTKIQVSPAAVRFLWVPAATGCWIIFLKFLSEPNGLKTKTSPQTSTEGTAAVGDDFFHCFYTYRTLSLPGTAIGLCCSGSKILVFCPRTAVKIIYLFYRKKFGFFSLYVAKNTPAALLLEYFFLKFFYFFRSQMA